jgi:hypothetical protein
MSDVTALNLTNIILGMLVLAGVIAVVYAIFTNKNKDN